ncbi:MAG TPA: winged helix-turn-helix transcriptional regulator [Candidatus Thermoplasmatota archaeon]|nr:winged helix-turn-helix transcriptional regulator [Candidatus Thermoplasmatota archaeon]
MSAMAPQWQTVMDRSPGRVLKHPLRALIRQAVERNPGMVPQDLATQLGCNRSTVRYHITRMQAAGIVRVVSHNQRAHVFPATMAAACQDALAVLQRGRTWDLARQVAQHPGLPQCDLTTNLNMSRKILRKYMDRLLRHGLIEEVDEPPFLTYYPTQALQAMVEAWDPARGKPPDLDARLEPKDGS